jgi:hypothetical protein
VLKARVANVDEDIVSILGKEEAPNDGVPGLGREGVGNVGV